MHPPFRPILMTGKLFAGFVRLFPGPIPLTAHKVTWRVISEQNKTCFTFVITLKEEDAAIGIVDMRLKKDGRGTYGERGFSLSRQYWGKGIMQEATLAVTDFIFNNTHCYKIVTFNALNNLRSHNIQQKQNFKLIGIRESAVASHNGCRDQEEWELLRKTWLEKAMKSDLSL